jgi:hypothetical protein
MAQKFDPGAAKDRTLFYTDLAFMPSEDKNALWAAQALFFAKLNNDQFLSSSKKQTYRNLEKGIINKQTYREIIDPKLNNGEGGTAEYFASDFDDCPISQHIDNILRAKLEKIGATNKLQVATIDKFSVSQKQRDKSRIIWQREFRKLINDNLQLLDLPVMKESENPFAYVKNLGRSEQTKMIDSVDTLLDYIKSQIRDEHDLALYEAYIYKGDIEIAFELGIEHFLINLNKWNAEKADWFNNDLKNFNKACGRAYTDDTTGRMLVDYMEPDELFTSRFHAKNGEDIVYWFHEFDKTFADFVRELGTQLDENQLKKVFELNKNWSGPNGGGFQGHGQNWSSAGNFKGSNAKIRIGYFSVLTQDADTFSEKLVDDQIGAYKIRKLDWRPHPNTPDSYKETPRTKIYNVWYSCYYVVPPDARLKTNTIQDWAWQSQYIFKLKKDIDMYRYGVDARYAKSTLVVWKDETRMSYTDIKESYMPKIRTTWHRFQNSLVSDVSGTFIAADLMTAILRSVDEGNKKHPESKKKATGGNGKDAGITAWRQFRQAAMAMHAFRDENGKMILDPEKLFIEFDNKQLDRAERYIKIILEQYNLFTLSVAQNDISEGQDAKPRTPVAGIQASMTASTLGTWFIERPAQELLVMFAERCVQFIINMVKERKKYGFPERFEEFAAVIGMANAMMLESVEDMQPEELGITVNLEDVSAMKQFYIELTNQMLHDGQVGKEDVQMIISTIQQDYKYGAILLSIAAKKQERAQDKKDELAHKRQMELGQQQLQIAQQLTAAKGQAKDVNIKTQGNIDARLMQIENDLKANTLAIQKDQLRNNKLKEIDEKGAVERQNKTADLLEPAT